MIKEVIERFIGLFTSLLRFYNSCDFFHFLKDEESIDIWIYFCGASDTLKYM